MRLILAFATLVTACAGTAASAKLPPLRDPVFLNIGFVCRWQVRCMDRQQSAMKKSLKYVRKHDPPKWKVELCNRNASRNRGRGRVDWIGFYNCIRNDKIRRPAWMARR